MVKKVKMKLKKGDKVVIIAGKDKGKEGKILVVDRSKNRVIVEGANKMKKHMKSGKSKKFQQGGIIEMEAPIHASNVMYLHKGKPTKIGIQETVVEQDGKKKTVRKRVAKSTGEVID